MQIRTRRVEATLASVGWFPHEDNLPRFSLRPAPQFVWTYTSGNTNIRLPIEYNAIKL